MKTTSIIGWLFIVAITLNTACLQPSRNPETPNDPAKRANATLIDVAIDQLVSIQEEGGMWPYEGVYRVGGEIPVGYRVGGTAIACEALLLAADRDNVKSQQAMSRGIEYILAHLDHSLMQESLVSRYDVRVWGQAYALQFFCHLLEQNRAGKRADEIERWVSKLATTLVAEQLEDGGWNYASRRSHASFVTAPVVQSLLYARAQGVVVSNEVFDNARNVLESSRESNGAFHYSGTSDSPRRRSTRAKVPGSIGRSPLCETTLLLLGHGSQESIQTAIDAFHEHWDELEKRRKQNGTHVPPYGIAPYYFYFAHRYAAQAIEMLPEPDRARERTRFDEKLGRTRDEDGTWNDRVFARSRNYGTAMSILALLHDRTPVPRPLSR